MVDFLPKIKIEIVAPDQMADTIVETIVSSAKLVGLGMENLRAADRGCHTDHAENEVKRLFNTAIVGESGE